MMMKKTANTNFLFSLLFVLAKLSLGFVQQQHCHNANNLHPLRSSMELPAMKKSSTSREDEIRRKIMKLKRQGKISPESSSSGASSSSPKDTISYEQKVRQKLGKQKSKLLGFTGDGEEDDEFAQIQQELDMMDLEEETKQAEVIASSKLQGSIGAQPVQEETSVKETTQEKETSESSIMERVQEIEEELEELDVDELSEEDLVELVQKKLQERNARRSLAEKLTSSAPTMTSTTPTPTTKESNQATSSTSNASAGSSSTSGQLTSGVGGKWNKSNSTDTEYYKPKSGSWGAFPRPKDISRAYGGGRRVGPGFSEEEMEASRLSTQEKLRAYREKVGIEVASEKEHAEEIEEALQIGKLAMQRGVYATAVSSLEKVTKWCSTNSKVGSKVFLELAMAYEATGRTQEAYRVYTTLSDCRMEDVKYHARRLKYGLEAMDFMKDISSEFSRKKAKTTFIETTGMQNFASNFDDVYQTAYIDLNGNYYKKLTESVVRSSREARQILLRATGKGEVGRMRVVQALRSISRSFSDALMMEVESAKKVETVAVMDGKPIMQPETSTTLLDESELGDFFLAPPDQMMENLEGQWQLQLIADKKGDGVSFYNTTEAIQTISSESKSFSASGPQGILQVSMAGDIGMDKKRRVLFRKNLETSGMGGGFFGFFGGKETGFVGSIARDHQVMVCDSELLITKYYSGRKPIGGSSQSKENEKDHFSVWRRVDSPPSLP